MATYLIPEYKFDGLQKKANQVQKKCQKFGCDFHFEVIGEHYKEIKDNGRRVIMCHYPMPFYRSDYNSNVYMLYGHVHTTIEYDFMEYIKDMIKEKDLRGDSTNKCQLYNVGCMMPWMKYFPRTLDEIIDGYNKEKKYGH